MRNSTPLNAAALVLAGSLSVSLWLPAFADDDTKKDGPSHVEPISGSELKRVTLTQKAAERLDIKTANIAADASGILAVPYSALLYDLKGKTWVYTVPQPLTYVRHAVLVESIKGERALLKEGPPPGTSVVVVGAAELYGAEKGVGH